MRTRLLLSFVLIVLVTITSLVFLTYRGAASEVRAFMFPGEMAGIQTLAKELEEYYNTNQAWQGVAILFQFSGRRQGMGPGMQPGMGARMMNQHLRLADANGILIYDTNDPQPNGQLNPAEISRAILLNNGNRRVGYLVTEGGMVFTASDERFLVGRLSRAALTAGLIAGGLSLFLALLLSYGLLQPVRELTHAARLLANGDLSQRVPVRGVDELSTLGHTFNQMAVSLQRAEETRRAMTADIAHELRNPLAVQRANLEALQDGIYPLTPESLTPILDQNLLLTRLVEDLRTLALADSGQLRLEQTATNLPGLVRRVIERFEPQAASHQIMITLKIAGQEAAYGAIPSIPEIPLDPMRMEQVLGNLLSNALRYTPDGGKIDLKLQRTPTAIELTIHDSGPGIPAEALPHIFERFYRADASRNRVEGGTGIGLAIARQLVQVQGGDLTAANHPQGGAVFTLTLPITPNETQ